MIGPRLFLREYRRELLMDGPIDKWSVSIKNHGQKFTLRLLKRLAKRQNVTIMCHCDDDQERLSSPPAQELIQNA